MPTMRLSCFRVESAVVGLEHAAALRVLRHELRAAQQRLLFVKQLQRLLELRELHREAQSLKAPLTAH